MHLAIFAKYWTPGEAKTRLAEGVGSKAAARLARAFVKATMGQFAGVAERRRLVITPATRRRAFERMSRGRFEIAVQGEGSLGDRLQQCFASLFAKGSQRVVVLGADSPNLPVEFVEQAFARLEREHAVIGPSRDGGFYLLGMRDKVLPIFEGIAWGTADVLRQTLARLNQMGASFGTLPEWYDVDTVNDLARLRSDLATTAEHDAACRRLLRTVVRLMERPS